MGRIVVASAMLSITAVAAGQSSEIPADMDALSVNDLMLTVVAPATDVLWGIDDPVTDEDWQVYIDAADTVIAAGTGLKKGGTGPNDDRWAAEPAWQTFSDQLIAAATEARQAAINQDVEAMYAAGDVLYPPCETCHLAFHPGVAEPE